MALLLVGRTGGGQNGLGGVMGASLPHFFVFTLPCPAQAPMVLPSLLDFCFLTIRNRQQTAPELQSLPAALGTLLLARGQGDTADHTMGIQ